MSSVKCPSYTLILKVMNYSLVNIRMKVSILSIFFPEILKSVLFTLSLQLTPPDKPQFTNEDTKAQLGNLF